MVQETKFTIQDSKYKDECVKHKYKLRQTQSCKIISCTISPLNIQHYAAFKLPFRACPDSSGGWGYPLPRMQTSLQQLIFFAAGRWLIIIFKPHRRREAHENAFYATIGL